MSKERKKRGLMVSSLINQRRGRERVSQGTNYISVVSSLIALRCSLKKQKKGVRFFLGLLTSLTWTHVPPSLSLALSSSLSEGTRTFTGGAVNKGGVWKLTRGKGGYGS